MKSYSASYNFPNGFFWGIHTPKNFASTKDNYTQIFRIKENKLNAAAITLDWADYEPLKNNYEESLIESARFLLSRIRNENLESIIILNISEIPAWQNLEHKKENGFFEAEKFNFATHIANSLVPYTNYFGLQIPAGTMYSAKEFHADLETHEAIRDYIISLSDTARVGLILPARAFQYGKTGIAKIFSRSGEKRLQNTKADFLGILPDGESFSGLQKEFGELKKPLFFFSDRFRKTPADEQPDILSDNLYDIWNFYQKGWPILGFFSDMDLMSDTQTNRLYAEFAQKNALELSTDNPLISEKWINFLKS